MSLITVVLPVYNVADFVSDSIQSILNQNYSNIELIIVNDGSTDNSLEICEKYVEKDSRVQLISKENGGLSSARNEGIKRAKGQYICFIDSDDWIEQDYLSLLLEGIQKYKADIAVIQMIKVSHFDKIKFTTETSHEWQSFSKEIALKNLFINNIIGYSANNKLYKTSLFETILYPKGMLMEDKGTTYRLIDKAQKVVVNKSTKYHYYLRGNSILRQRFNQKNFDSFEIHNEILTFFQREYPELLIHVQTRYIYESIRMMMRMIESNYSNEQDFERCMKILQKYKNAMSQDETFSVKIKFLTHCLLVFKKFPYKISKYKFASNFLRKLEGIK